MNPQEIIINFYDEIQMLFHEYGINEPVTQENIYQAIQEDGEPFAEDLADIIGYNISSFDGLELLNWDGEDEEYATKRDRRKAKKQAKRQSGAGNQRLGKAMDVMGGLFSAGLGIFSTVQKAKGNPQDESLPVDKRFTDPNYGEDEPNNKTIYIVIAVVVVVLIILFALVMMKKK